MSDDAYRDALAALPPHLREHRARLEASPRTTIGLEAAFLAGGGTCIHCWDRGLIRHLPGSDPVYCPCALGLDLAAEAARRAALRAEADRAALIQAHTGRADIPHNFLGRTLDTWPGVDPGRVSEAGLARGRKVLAALRQWAGEWPERGLSLVLHGRVTGTGKSSLSTALLQGHIAATAAEGLFVDSAQMIARLRPTDWQDNSLLGRVATAPALVLDDLGVTTQDARGEALTGFVAERLYTIVNNRYNARLWTIYTTNLEGDAGFRDYLGERLYWRIKEVSRWIEPGKENFRDR